MASALLLPTCRLREGPLSLPRTGHVSTDSRSAVRNTTPSKTFRYCN
jgi:hypothetical protein